MLGAGGLLGKAQMLFNCVQQREWSWKLFKERGNLGQQGRKRAKEGIYFFGILLFAPGEKNIHESPSATLVQPGLHHSIHEGGADSSQPV